jgi:hypothetical protein
MKRFFVVFIAVLAIVYLGGCSTATLQIKPANMAGDQVNFNLLVLPHQSLGLEPTEGIRKGDLSVFLVKFPLRLFGEYYPGRLRWNAWTILPDGSERFGQVIFSGMHPSGDYFGTMILDGRILTGQTAILSSVMDYIYSPLGQELAVDREKFLSDPAYRKEKIREVNKDQDGNVFDLQGLSRLDGFREVLKTWNQIQTPEGNLLSPYGVNEVAVIRGINPQYSYFEKLAGTGNFRVSPIPDPTGLIIVNSIGVVMDLIRAGKAPATGWDYNSEIPSRRNMAFVMEYLLALAENEIKARNEINAAQLIEALSAPRR